MIEEKIEYTKWENLKPYAMEIVLVLAYVNKNENHK